MANALTLQVVLPPGAAAPISTARPTILACQKGTAQASSTPCLQRRVITWGLVGSILGMEVGHEQKSLAAARRPPPSPPDKGKKDPNVSGVLAKVLASKRRKEAMKEAMAKQREKGKVLPE